MQWQMIVLKFQYYIQLSSSLFLMLFFFLLLELVYFSWLWYSVANLKYAKWKCWKVFDIDSINNKDWWLELINKIKKKRRRSGKKRIEKPIKKIMVMRTTYCNSWIFKVKVTSGDKQQEKNPEKKNNNKKQSMCQKKQRQHAQIAVNQRNRSVKINGVRCVTE